MQECQKIYQLDSNAKGKQNPFLNNFSLPWHTPTWVGLCTMRPPEDFELPLDWLGRDEMLWAAMASYPGTGGKELLPASACLLSPPARTLPPPSTTEEKNNLQK